MPSLLEQRCRIGMPLQKPCDPTWKTIFLGRERRSVSRAAIIDDSSTNAGAHVLSRKSCSLHSVEEIAVDVGDPEF